MIEPGVILNNRYRVLRQLGEGGMGAVFEAEHTGVGRRVAVKVLHAQFAKQPEIVGRFEREARAAAAIGHDNIIDVLDVGSHDGTPFMIMEFLKGESLGARIEARGRLTVPEALHVMTQVLSALNAAHAAGIVHRDLKPDNVYLIQRAGVADFVKLLDFGVSKFKSEPGESKGLTQTGAMMGTPYYMAPEQALAKRDIDHRADLYSAGVMLYQLVTGTLPFLAESQAELLMAIVYQPFGITPPRQHNPELPEALEAVILKAMCKEREGRFADCAEFAAALGALDVPGLAGVGVGTLGGALTGATRGATPHNATPLYWETPVNGARRTTGQQRPQVAPTLVGTAGRTTGASATGGATPRRGALLAAAAGLVLALGAGGLLAARMHGHAGPSPSVTVAANGGHGGVHEQTAAEQLEQARRAQEQQAREQAAAQLAAAQRAAAQQIAIDLDGLPVGASVEVDGQRVETTHLHFAPGSTHALRVAATGMHPYESSIRADRDRTIVVALVPDAPIAPLVAADSTATGGNTVRTDTGGSRGRTDGRGHHAGQGGNGAAVVVGGHGGSTGLTGTGAGTGSGHTLPNLPLDPTYR
jgi:serine/threonine-protein kinase